MSKYVYIKKKKKLERIRKHIEKTGAEIISKLISDNVLLETTLENYPRILLIH